MIYPVYVHIYRENSHLKNRLCPKTYLNFSSLEHEMYFFPLELVLNRWSNSVILSM